jgi:hypothetical protein
MKSKQKEVVLKSQVCPIHQTHPVLVFRNDLFTIRCCCNFLTQKYISVLESKLKGIAFETILNGWENDLLINELQTKKIGNMGKAINKMLTIKHDPEQ